MSEMAVSASDLTHWREWIGTREEQVEQLDVEAARRYAAAIGEDMDVEQRLPSLVHWAYFLPTVPTSKLGPDGVPARGGFIPPITLPRRMFAASSISFADELVLGREARRVSTISDVLHKSGRTGELVLVEIDHSIEQGGRTCITERQTIVYRGFAEPQPPVIPLPVPPAGDVQWNPGTMDLFRFSAVTFNTHRIHYDLPYATGEEGYPALLIHGVFTAAKLFGFATTDGVRPANFAFRAMAPLFQGQPVAIAHGETANEVRALRCDGAVAMSAVLS